jgi:hypothetical protein
MNACAELLALHPSPTPRHLQQQRMAFLVAGSAALEVGARGALLAEEFPIVARAPPVTAPPPATALPCLKGPAISAFPCPHKVLKLGNGKQRKSSLSLASRMVAASRHAAARLAELEPAGGGASSKGGGGRGQPGAGGAGGGALVDVFTALQEFGIAAHRGDTAAMAGALEAAAALPCVAAEHLLKMAAVAEDPEFR